MARRPGLLSESAAAKLLMAAALIDVGLLYFVTKTIARALPDNLTGFVPTFDGTPSKAEQFVIDYAPSAVPVLIFLALAIAFQTVTEAFLGGRTPGRSLMGLKLCQKSGGPLTRKGRLARGMRKLTTLGISGLQVAKLPSYDSAVGCAWSSTMATPKPLAPSAWKIVIRTPDGRSKSRALGDIAGFRQNQLIKLGRDKSWADIVLPDETLASARHCVVRLNKGRLELRDNDSSNGTRIEKRRIAPAKWVFLGPNQTFFVANVLCKIDTS